MTSDKSQAKEVHKTLERAQAQEASTKEDGSKEYQYYTYGANYHDGIYQKSLTEHYERLRKEFVAKVDTDSYAIRTKAKQAYESGPYAHQ